MQERKMSKKEKSKEKRLKKKYDDSDMKASMKKQYGKDWKTVYYATIRKKAMENIKEAEENTYTVVHAKHGKEVIKATSSYGAAKKYADMKKLKSTAGVDAHLMEGYQILPSIDKERYTEIPGMEGPMMTRSGKVVYYDPQEGAYYDRDTDMYLSYEEWKALDESMSDVYPPRGDMEMDPSNMRPSGAPKTSPRPRARPKDLVPPMPRPKPRPKRIGGMPGGSTRGIDPRDNYSPEDLKRLLMQSAYENMDFYKNMNKALQQRNKDKNFRSNMPIAQPNKDSRINTDFYKDMQKSLTKRRPYRMIDSKMEEGVKRNILYREIGKRLAKGHSIDKIKKHYKDIDDAHPGHIEKIVQALKDRNEIPEAKMLEGYEGEVSAILQALDIEHHWSNGHLHVNKRDIDDVRDRLADTDMDMPSIKVYEGFASDAQRKAAFASGYDPKKKKKNETVDIKKVKSAVNMQESTDSQAVAEYIRINLNESHDTWEKVNEEVYHVIGNLTEGHSADPLEVYSAVHKRHMQQYFDHEMGIKENVNTLRKIVKDRSAMTVKFEDGTMKVDMTTANIFLQAYDQMKERNQEKIDQMMRTKAGFLRVMDFIYGAMK